MSRYIDADRLIDELNRREIEHRADIDEVIMTTPTEDVKPVKYGKWRAHPIDRDWDICDNCGVGCKRREHGVDEDGIGCVTEYNYPYCPNCGADMKEGTDNG